MDTNQTIPSNPQVIETDGLDIVEIPGTNWLMSADFIRDGDDLYVVGKDGQEFLLTDYFGDDTPPDLKTASGAVLKADTVEKFAGPEAPAQVAQAGPIAVLAPIGRIDTMDGTVEATRADGSKVTLSEGEPVFEGDVIETADAGSVSVILADNSSFSLGQNGRVVLDEMVYDPSAQEGSMSLSFVQGVLSFVSGNIAKLDPDAMVINTPVATISIRGTTGVIDMPVGEELTVLLSENADGSVGEITVTNDAGVQVLSQAFQATSVAAITAPPSNPFNVNPAEFFQKFGSIVKSVQDSEARANSSENSSEPAAQPSPSEPDQPAPDASKTESHDDLTEQKSEADAVNPDEADQKDIDQDHQAKDGADKEEATLRHADARHFAEKSDLRADGETDEFGEQSPDAAADEEVRTAEAPVNELADDEIEPAFETAGDEPEFELTAADTPEELADDVEIEAGFKRESEAEAAGDPQDDMVAFGLDAADPETEPERQPVETALADDSPQPD